MELAILGLIVTAGTGLLDLLQVALVLALGLVAFRAHLTLGAGPSTST